MAESTRRTTTERLKARVLEEMWGGRKSPQLGGPPKPVAIFQGLALFGVGSAEKLTSAAKIQLGPVGTDLERALGDDGCVKAVWAPGVSLIESQLYGTCEGKGRVAEPLEIDTNGLTALYPSGEGTNPVTAGCGHTVEMDPVGLIALRALQLEPHPIERVILTMVAK